MPDVPIEMRKQAIVELKRLVEERVAVRSKPMRENGQKFVNAVRALPDRTLYAALDAPMRATIDSMILRLETKLLCEDVIAVIDDLFPRETA